MNSNKDSKKLKDILLGIDIALLIIAIVLCSYCGYRFVNICSLENNDFEARMSGLTRQLTEIQALIDERRPQVEAMVSQREAELQAAEKERSSVQDALFAAIELRDNKKQEKLDMQTSIEELKNMPDKIAALRTEYGQTVRKLEDMIMAGESKYRIVYLTFDDGPSYLTEAFLDELDRLDVYATFFTIGVGVQSYSYEDVRDPMLKEEARRGHTIANHTYSHAFNGGLYNSVDSFMEQVKKQDDLVYEVTGIHTDIVRFPAGSYYCRNRKGSIEALDEAGYGWIDWLGNAYDSGNNNYPSYYISQVVINQARTQKIYVVLMHDWVNSTRLSLEKIVTTLKNENYVFLPLFKESSQIGNVYPKWDN